jgi:hypothetical protein
MKKLSMLSTLAACILALPVAAAVLKEAANTTGDAAVSGGKADVSSGTRAQGAGQADGNSAAVAGSADAQAHRDGTNSNASLEATVDANGHINRAAQRRIEERVHKSYRSFAKRLNKVETRLIEEANKAKKWTREQVQEHRDRIQAIRAKFRDKADKLGDHISAAEKKELNADITAEEKAVAKAGRK